jgi:hypothetical protein
MKKNPSSSSHQQLNNGFLAQEMPLSLGGWIFITASLILLSFIGSLVLSLILMQQGSLHINRLLFVVVNLVLTLWLWITMFGRKKRFIILAIAYFTAATLISFFSFIQQYDYRHFWGIALFTSQVMYLIKSRRVQKTFVY